MFAGSFAHVDLRGTEVLAYLPQHITELWAVGFGLLFVGIGLTAIARAGSASIYRDGARPFSAVEREPRPASQRVPASTSRVAGVMAVLVGVWIALRLSRQQTACQVCLDDPWCSTGWVIGSVLFWLAFGV